MKILIVRTNWFFQYLSDPSALTLQLRCFLNDLFILWELHTTYFIIFVPLPPYSPNFMSLLYFSPIKSSLYCLTIALCESCPRVVNMPVVTPEKKIDFPTRNQIPIAPPLGVGLPTFPLHAGILSILSSQVVPILSQVLWVHMYIYPVSLMSFTASDSYLSILHPHVHSHKSLRGMCVWWRCPIFRTEHYTVAYSLHSNSWHLCLAVNCHLLQEKISLMRVKKYSDVRV